jgi:predicted metal-dependent hydrolase
MAAACLYRYRRNARARRIIMRMDKQAQGIVLTVPEGTSFMRALEFAQLAVRLDLAAA